MKGPQPAAPPPHLTPARARVLQAVADAPGSTLSQLSDALGGHPNTTRQHLESMAAERLIDIAPLPRSGPGRRPLGFTLSAHGRRALALASGVDAGPLGALIAYVEAGDAPVETATSIGRLWGEREVEALGLDEPHADASGALATTLDALGYDPRADGDDLVLRACPMLAVAGKNPGVVCALHGGMLDAVAEHLDVSVTLRPFSDADGCRVFVGGAGAPR